MKSIKNALAALALMCTASAVFSGCNFIQVINTGADFLEGNTPVLVDSDESEEGENKTYSSVENYVKSPINHIALSAIIGPSDDEKDNEIKAEGENLVFEYRYKQIYDEKSKKSMAAAHSEKYKFDSSNFTNLADTLKREVEVKNPKVIVRYYNGDGTIIYELTYKPTF